MNRRAFLHSVSASAAGAVLPAADDSAETGMIGIGGRGIMGLRAMVDGRVVEWKEVDV